jgi:hypothetical protein
VGVLAAGVIVGDGGCEAKGGVPAHRRESKARRRALVDLGAYDGYVPRGTGVQEGVWLQVECEVMSVLSLSSLKR